MIKGLPPGVRRQAFRAVVAALRTSPLLANDRIVRTWRVWDGSKTVAEPTVAEMPCVQVQIAGGPIERLATIADGGSAGLPTVDIRTQPTILIETWVAGTSADDAMDLYDALDLALFPADPLARDRLVAAFRAVGISDWQPVRDVLPEHPGDYQSAAIHSIGAYRLTLDLTQ